MSRDGGFEVGDRSTRTLYDTRLIRAYRIAGLGVIVAWDALVDESWAKGERVTIEDAVLPLPYLLDVDAIRGALYSVELIDLDGFIREDSWDHWFGPAYTRREAKRERDRAYAKKAASSRWDSATDTLASRERVARDSYATVRPSVRPTDRPSVLRAPARETPSKDGTNGKSFDELGVARPLPVAMGFHPAPKPEPRKRR